MSEFIIGNPLRNVARKFRPLRLLLWRLDFALVWLVMKIGELLPVDTASRFGNRAGRLLGPTMKRKTATFRENMAIAFPELSGADLDRLVVLAWGNAGRIVTEYPHLGTILNDPGRLTIDIREPIETYKNPGRPCVIVAAHQSNWEVVCSALAKMGIPNASLYSPPTNPYLDRLLLDSRRALNCELLPRDNAARLLMRAMKQGRTAGMVIDRRVDEGTPIEFFGHDKQSTVLPARLALKFHCDLVPVQVERVQDARYRVTFHPPVRPTDTSVDETAQAIDMIQQVHHQFEDWIRQQPQDWFCSKRLWWRAKRNPWNSKKEAGRNAGIDRHAA